MFSGYRHHGIFTDSPLLMLQAETIHRGHAIVEQVITDVKASATAPLASASLSANGAWLVLAAMALNPTRAAGALAALFHAKATIATIRRQLIAQRGPPAGGPPRSPRRAGGEHGGGCGSGAGTEGQRQAHP